MLPNSDARSPHKVSPFPSLFSYLAKAEWLQQGVLVFNLCFTFSVADAEELVQRLHVISYEVFAKQNGWVNNSLLAG